MSNQALLDAALDALARGWSVIPVEPRGKRPLVRWREYQERHPTPSEVRGWFVHWPKANLAVVTGIESGIVVLDVDKGHGGEASLAVLEQRHGALPATVEALTGGGGRHLYFAHPGGFLPNCAKQAGSGIAQFLLKQPRALQERLHAVCEAR